MIAALAAVTIRWLGQACFLITTAHGTPILIDPESPKVGYAVTAHSVSAAAVFVSHEHFDHNWTEMASGDPLVVQPLVGPGPEKEGAVPSANGLSDTVRYQRIFAYHDNSHGSQRGPDTITVLNVDGLRICHLGDLGQYTLTPQQIKEIGRVDVLMIPVGGYFTIDGQQATVIVSELHPRVIIPMHYKTPAVNGDLQTDLHGTNDFLQASGDSAQTVTVSTRDLTLDPKRLPRKETIYILKYE